MDTAETSSEAAGANIITVPFEERNQISETRRHCQTLRRSVESLRECLRTIESMTGSVDDRRGRENLQCHIDALNELLLLKLSQLSTIDHALQETLRSMWLRSP